MTEAVIDANVLLRHLTGQPAALAHQARALLQTAERKKVRLTVTALTVAEVVFVLERTYRWSRREISARLQTLLAAEVVHVAEHRTLAQALALYHDYPRVHFADAYVAAVALERDAALISFDRDLRVIPDLRLIAAPGDLPV